MSDFRVQLIAPLSEGFQGSNNVFSLPFASLPTLAAYTPEDVQQELVHEKHSTVDTAADVDLVGLTVMTPCAPRAYTIADAFRARGVQVVMGGIHPTVKPDEALEHADAICVGEGEQVWPKMVEDAKAGRLERVYENPGRASREFTLRTPRRDLLPTGQYFGGKIKALFVETTRGCPYDCDFCAVTTFFGQHYRVREIEEIRAELEEAGVPKVRQSGRRNYLNHVLAFTDDNFFGKIDHAVRVMELIREYDVRWFGQTTLRITDKPEILELCRASGCLGFEIGFESLAPEKYRKTGRVKGMSQEQYYLERIRMLHGYGIGINGSFMFGNDEDTVDVFAQYARFIDEARIQTPYLAIRTPYPGTPLYYEFKEDDRLLHERWDLYDTAHCVFQPVHMTPEQLEAGYRWAWRYTTAHHRMLARNLFRGPLFRFWGAAALGFRMSTRAEHEGLERRHPGKLPGREQPWVKPERSGAPELPRHIAELRARPRRKKAETSEA